MNGISEGGFFLKHFLLYVVSMKKINAYGFK